jgi:hypothetical protein
LIQLIVDLGACGSILTLQRTLVIRRRRCRRDLLSVVVVVGGRGVFGDEFRPCDIVATCNETDIEKTGRETHVLMNECDIDSNTPEGVGQ